MINHYGLQGEYIAPEKIEAIYVRAKYVAQIFVYGESLKTCIIAIVVPEREVVLEPFQNNYFLLNSLPFVKMFHKHINSRNQKNGLISKFLLLIQEVMELAAELNIKETSFEKLCKKSDIKAAILNEMTNMGKLAGLCSFEQVHRKKNFLYFILYFVFCIFVF